MLRLARYGAVCGLGYGELVSGAAGKCYLRGPLFYGDAFRQNLRLSRALALINITQQHRTIWLKAFDSPKLKRVLSKSPRTKQPTQDERLFVNLILLHLTSTLYAVRKGALDKPAGLDVDLQEFFALPIPAAVWRDTKHLRDKYTASYIENLLAKKSNPK